jgi:hypothetical protein
LKAKDIIGQILDGRLAPELKRQGFRKKAFRFFRRKGAVEQEIRLHLSSFNWGANGSFTVHVILQFDEMWCEPEPRPSLAKGGHGDFFTNIGILLPGVPRSFDVDRTIPIQDASERLATWVMEGLVAPLNRVESLADFEATGWKDVMPWSFPTRFAYHMGRDDEATRLVRIEADFFADRGVTEENIIERYRLHRLRNKNS